MRGTERPRRRAAVAIVLGVAAITMIASGCGVKEPTGDEVAGKQLFVAKCGSCHQLYRAGTKGNVGPNLDQAFQQALKDGFKRDTVQGMVHGWILFPNRNGVMPAKVVEGDDAYDVAAYVAGAVAKPGKDTGALATAVKAAGGGKPAVAANGKLEIAADPNGQLAFVTKVAQAPAGKLGISSKNASTTPHNIALEGNGLSPVVGPIGQGGHVSNVDVTVNAGKYQYFCTVPGHRAAGMEGVLTVK